MRTLRVTIYLFLYVLQGVILLGWTPSHAQNQFNRAYRFPTPRPAVLPFEPKQKMVINSGENSFTVGTYSPINGSPTIFVMRTDQDGNVDWVNEYHLPGSVERANTLEVSHNEQELVISGKVNPNNPQLPNYVIIFKISQANGAVIWANDYSNIFELNTMVKRSTGGINYYVLGGKRIEPGVNLAKPVAIAINDVDGSLRWAYQYNENQPNYALNFHNRITGFAVQPNQVAFTGIYHNTTNSERLISFFRLQPFTGSIIGNVLYAYDIEDDSTDVAIATSGLHVWDIARVQQPQSGNFNGYVISGTYVTSPFGQPQTSETALLRIDQNGVPLWANLYDHADDNSGFGRGVYQDQNDLLSLDVFSKHGIGSRRSGFLSVDLPAGNLLGFREHNFGDNPGFSSSSMNRIPGTSGYIGLAQFVSGTNAQDKFQLISMDVNGAADADCEKQPEIDVVGLGKKRIIIELEKEVLGVQVSNCSLQREGVGMSTRECPENASLEGACWVRDMGDYVLTQCDDGKCYVFYDTNTSRAMAINGGYGVEIDCDDINVRKGYVKEPIEDNEGMSIAVFPNPLSSSGAQWQFIASNLPEEASAVRVLDGAGRVMLHEELNTVNGNVEIELQGQLIPSGLYVLQVLQQEGVIYQMKLIKE